MREPRDLIIRTFEVRVSDELSQLIEGIKLAWNTTEDEAVERILYSIISQRKTLFVNSDLLPNEIKSVQNQKLIIPIEEKAAISKKKWIEWHTILIALAFLFGALLAIVYVLFFRKG